MKIEKIEVNAMALSFEPEFHITVHYTYPLGAIIPLRFNGYLFLDRFRFAFLHEYEYKHGRNEPFLATNSSKKFVTQDRRNFVAPISRAALLKLDEKRNADPKGDLKFNLHIQVVMIESLFTGIKKSGSQEPFTMPALAEGALFKTVTKEIDHDVTIPSSNWIHEFSAKFEQQRFQVFEVPMPTQIESSSDFSNRLNAAISSLGAMEREKLVGDWEAVLKESRPVWELIKNKQDILDLLANEGLNTDTINAYRKVVESLFDFSSKFIHREAKDKTLMSVNTVRKEDAELMYSLAVTIVNLIAKKLKRSL